MTANGTSTFGRHVNQVLDVIRRETGSDESVENNLRAAREIMSQIPPPGGGQGFTKGLLLGRIQAGKTLATATVIAAAADAGYRVFVVLTSDNTWLYSQTFGRLTSALPGLHIPDYDDIAMIPPDQIRSTGVVFVVTKNATRLQNLTNEIEALGVSDLPAMIIDDEADQASLNTNAADPQEDPSRINSLITRLRDYFSQSVYLQVTATPNSLLLQQSNHDFRPEFVTVLQPGRDYTGGDVLLHEDDRHIRYVDPDEIIGYLTGQTGIPQGLRRAIYNFLIAATLQQRAGQGSAFSFLCHVSARTNDHELMRRAVLNVLNEVATVLDTGNQESPVAQGLRLEYDDLIQTSQSRLTFEEVLEFLRTFLPSRDIQVLNSQSELSEPRYNRIFNFMIGGNRLGRGVTIQRLLTTYYGRDTRYPQMDTMQQHARMYGYRRRDLDVIRIFAPAHIIERFRLLDEADRQLRRMAASDEWRGLEPIFVGHGMRPTRMNVLSGDIGMYVAGTVYSPAFPAYERHEIASLTQQLDELLKPYQREDQAYPISIDEMINILRLTRSRKSPGGGRWDDERIRAALQSIAHRYPQGGWLIVKRDRQLRRPEGRLRDPSSHQDRGLGSEHEPTLWMYRQNGGRESGWDDCPFWIPRLRFPRGNYVITFNFE